MRAWRGGIFNLGKNNENIEAARTEPIDTSYNCHEDKVITTFYNLTFGNNKEPEIAFGGSGTASSPYTITSSGQLAWLSYLVYNKPDAVTRYKGKYFKQTADITVDACWWVPIGAANKYFTGNYDGNGYRVDGVFTQSNVANAGIFGYTSGGSIKNLGVKDSRIKGTNTAGGIVGYAASTTITNCYNINTGVEEATNKGEIVGHASGTVGELDKYIVNINALNPNGVEDGMSAYFDLEIEDSAKALSGIYTNLTDQPTTLRVGYGSRITITNIRPFSSGCRLKNVMATASSRLKRSGATYTYTVTQTDDILINMEIATRIVKVYPGTGVYDVIQPNSDWQNDSGGRYRTMTVNVGSSVTVEISMNEGYTFTSWTDSSGNTLSTSNPYTFTMGSSDITLCANGKRIQSTLTINPNGGVYQGGTDIAYDTRTYGSTVSVSVPTREGYTFKGWRVQSGNTGTLGNLGKKVSDYESFFMEGNSVGVYVYGGNTTLTRESASLQQSPFNTHVLKISTTGECTHENRNGFTFNTQTYADAEFIAIFEAKIPVGYSLNWASNYIGQGYANSYCKFLTSEWGTGDWETYVYYAKCDSSGSFSTTNFFYLYGPAGTTDNPVNWYLSQASVYDCTGMGLNTSTIMSNLSKETTYTYGTSDATIVAMWESDVWTRHAADSFAGGDGSAENPYQIASASQLAKLAKDSRASSLSGVNYKLTANIDISGHIWDGIGESGFSGVIDGGYYSINNLITSKGSYIPSANMGLVQFLDGGTLKNIILRDANIKSSIRAGGLAGVMYGFIQNCMVLDCRIEGTLSAGGLYCNGGRTPMNCIVKNCTIIGGSEGAGGLGRWTEGDFQDCAVINTIITATGNSGIVVGTKHYADRYPIACYGQGTVNGTTTKIMYGNSSVWGSWSYSGEINDGYPIQAGNFWIAGQSGSTNVYNYLKNTLGFSEA